MYLNIVGFYIDKTITETYTSNEEQAFDASSVTGIGCCGDQRTNETFDTHIPPFFFGFQVSICALLSAYQMLPGNLLIYFHSKEMKQ